jgi:hypothetical protein
MKVVFREIDDLAPLRILDPCLADVPFLRDGPIENLCTTTNFMDLQRDLSGKTLEGRPRPGTGDTPAQWV